MADVRTRRVRVLLRPDAARLEADGPLRLRGRLEEASFRGATTRLSVAVGGLRMTFDLPAEVDLPPAGSDITLSLDPERALQRLP